jgi:F-type H+-transporting ATPase subunit b
MLANNLVVWWIAEIAAIAILVYLFLRWRPGFLRGRSISQTVNQMLDARAEQVRTQLEAAQQSREEAARINEQSQQEIAQARQESEEIVSRAAQTSEAILQEMQRRAREEYERIVGQARAQIDYEREQAEVALRRRAADIVVDAAGQIVERYLEPQTDRQIIDSSLADLKEIR